MITEHSMISVGVGSQANLGNSPIPLSHRYSTRVAPANEQPFRGTPDAFAPPPRVAHPAAPTEPTLQLAGRKLTELEKLAITQTLQQCGGNRTRAARKLGISVRTLQRKLRMWGGKAQAASHSQPWKQETRVRT